MKLRILSVLFILLTGMTLWSQTGLVSGELNVSTIPTNNGNGTFSLVGNFSDPKGQTFAGDVTSGMSLWKGNNYFAITAASANGSELTLTVEDTYSLGFLGSGIYSVGELTNRLKLPGVSSTGDSNASLSTPPDYAAKLNFIFQLIDQGIPGATQGNTLSDTTSINNPADGELLIAGDTLSIYDGTQWVNLIVSSSGSDGQLGTDDQVLTQNRTTDFQNFTYTWDLTGATLDEVVHPVLAPDGRVYGWYIEDGAGEMSWLASEVLSTGYDKMIFHNLADRLELGGISDSTFINADKLFFNVQNLETDNSIPRLVGIDPVTGEYKEVDISSFSGSAPPAAEFVPHQDTLQFDNDYYYQPRIFPAGGLTYTVDTTGSKYGATIMAKVQSDTLPILFDLEWFDTTQMYNIRSGDTLTGTHNVYFEYTPYGVAVSVPTNGGFVANNDTTSTPPSNFTLPEEYPATVGTLEFELDGRFNISEIGDTVFWKSTVDTLDYFYNDVVGRKPDIITNGLLLDADDWLEAGPTSPFTHNTDPDGYAITYAINPSNANYSVITRAANETDRILAKNGNTDYCGSVIFTGQGGTAGLKVVTIDIPPSGTARLYINGVEVSTDTTIGGDARNATFDRIGRMVFEDFYLDGEIKYLALNRFTAGGITATEAQNIFIHINERILNEAL